MTTCLRTRIVRLLSLSALCAVACVSAANAQSMTLAELGSLLHRDAPGRVAYVEHQYRHVLKTPIEQRGELRFAPPSTFEKQVLEPFQELYRLSGDTLVVETPGRKTRQVSARNQPVLLGLLRGFQAVVAGRLEALSGYYDAELSGSADAWRLELVPREAQLARHVRKLDIAGRRGDVLRFEVLEVSGDRSVMELVR